MKTTPLLVCLTMFLPHLTAHAQEGILFRNSSLSRVVDFVTGAPVPPDTFTAGLYFNPDATATLPASNGVGGPFPGGGWLLAAATGVGVTGVPPLNGIYNGGTVLLPGIPPGQEFLLQVRVWSSGFPTYEAAFAGGDYCLAGSNLMGPFSLGGGSGGPGSMIDLANHVQSIGVCIPEPSPLLLACLALTALFLAFQGRHVF